MMKDFRSLFPVGAAVIASTLFSSPAHAASLGSLLTAAKNDLSPFGLVGCFAFAGIGLIVFGNGVLKLLRGGRGGGGGVGEAILWMVVGAVLLSLPAVILATSGTFTDSGASSGLSKLGIGS